MAILSCRVIFGIVLLTLPSALGDPKRPPNYHHDFMPDTTFSCEEKVVGGYYADIDAGCQMFHVCVQVDEIEIRDFKFMCPNDTVFDQENFICANWFDIDCNLSKKWYPKNNNVFAANGKGVITESPYEQGRRAQLVQREKLQEIQDQQTGRLKEHEKFLREQQKAVAAQQQKTLKEHNRQNTETQKEQLRQLHKQQEHLEEIDQRPVGRKVPASSNDSKKDQDYKQPSATGEYDYYYYDDYYPEESGNFYKHDEYDPDGRIVEPAEEVKLPVISPKGASKSSSSKTLSSTTKPSSSSSKPKLSSSSRPSGGKASSKGDSKRH